jgi:hypothetical protein
VDVPSHPAIVALSAALTDAADLLRVAVHRIAVERIEAREWPDSCLGAPEPGEGCADVVAPGYMIELGDGFTYHADRQGNFRRAPDQTPVPDTEIRLRYERSGGIGGWHTEFVASSETVSADEELELRGLIEAADFFNVRNGLPDSPIADGITTSLWIAVGRRNHTVTRSDGDDMDDGEALRELFAWGAKRAPEFGPGVTTVE